MFTLYHILLTNAGAISEIPIPGVRTTITLAVDNDEARHAFIERLTAKGVGLTQDLPPIVEGRDKTDWNDYLKMTKEGTQKDLKDIIETASYHTPKIIDVENKKSLENLQETVASNSEQQKKVENPIGDLPEQSQEAAPLPNTHEEYSLNESSPTQTQSQPLLHFTISEDFQSRDFF